MAALGDFHAPSMAFERTVFPVGILPTGSFPARREMEAVILRHEISCLEFLCLDIHHRHHVLILIDIY